MAALLRRVDSRLAFPFLEVERATPPGTVLTGWVGFAWGTDNSLRNLRAISDHLESLFFSSISIEFALVLMTIRS